MTAPAGMVKASAVLPPADTVAVRVVAKREVVALARVAAREKVPALPPALVTVTPMFWPAWSEVAGTETWKTGGRMVRSAVPMTWPLTLATTG